MTIAEAPTSLDGLASAAAIVLLFELSIFILLLAVLTVLLAFIMRWLYNHVIPPLKAAAPRVQGALNATDRATGRVVDVIANLYARRRSLEETITGFVEGILPVGPLDDEQLPDGHAHAPDSRPADPSDRLPG